MADERSAMIQPERMTQLFLELVQIRSATQAERSLAERLRKELTGLGLQVVEDDAGRRIGGDCGNLVANLAGSRPGPTLLFSAHMDTVEPSLGIRPKVEDGWIRAGGDTILGADDKAGIVAILEMLCVLREERLSHPPIQVLFSVAEESGLAGVRHLDRSLLSADLGYILDSDAAPGEIITSAPGQDRLEVTILGRSAHAGIAPEKGVNAILAAARSLAAMPLGRIDEETTANVGTIHGGRATNIIPDRVELALEARSRNLEKLAQQTRLMVGVFEKTARKHGAVAQIEVSRTYPPYRFPEEADVVQRAQRAARVAGLAPSLVLTGGGSDANFLNQYGVPSVVLGIGMVNPHTCEEAYPVAAFQQVASLLLALCEANP
jgi:tripeptide aminopeptidase